MNGDPVANAQHSRDLPIRRARYAACDRQQYLIAHAHATQSTSAHRRTDELDFRPARRDKEITVPDDFRFIINGQPMSVHQLKPGMKGTATITTTTTETPVTVTEVRNATVMQSSGSTILIRTNEGYKSFTQGEIDKRGVKIMKNGKPAQLSDFHAGDKLSATIITSTPPKILTLKEVAGILAAAPAAAPTSAAPAKKAPDSTGALASSGTATGAATPGGSGRTLPKTASSWPLFGLVSLLALGMGLGLTLRRLFVS
jgi:hypothetical protein